MGFVPLTGLLALLLLPLNSGATTLVRYDLATLTEEAVQIVVASCQSRDSHVSKGQIYTRTQLTVLQTLKGQPRKKIVMELPGGTHGNRSTHWAGMPQFDPAEEVVLFLTEADQAGNPWPLGLVQGKFRIDRQQAKKPVVVQSLEGVHFLSGHRHEEEGDSVSLDQMPLEEFLDQIRSYLAPVEGENNASH